MTFTIQEVPDWDIEENQMYDLTLPDILDEEDQCMDNAGNCLVRCDEIKLEDYQVGRQLYERL